MIDPFAASEPRPDELQVARQIPVELGGQGFTLSVLPIARNREWTALFASEIRAKLGEIPPLESADQVATMLAAAAEQMMDLLIAYDAAGSQRLPEREWIDTNATDREVYEALKRVTAAAYPFGVDLRVLVPEFVPMLMQSISRGVQAAALRMASSQPTSSSQPSTAGRRRKSKTS